MRVAYDERRHGLVILWSGKGERDLAELIRDDDSLTLKLTGGEKAEGVHGNIRIPVTSVRRVEILDDVIHAVHGLRAPGTGIPGMVAVGTFRSASETIFAVVHHQNKRGVKVSLVNAHFDALIIGSDNPEGLVESLGLTEP